MTFWIVVSALYVGGAVSTFLMCAAAAMFEAKNSNQTKADVALWSACAVFWPPMIWVAVIAYILQRK